MRIRLRPKKLKGSSLFDMMITYSTYKNLESLKSDKGTVWKKIRPSTTADGFPAYEFEAEGKNVRVVMGVLEISRGLSNETMTAVWKKGSIDAQEVMMEYRSLMDER
jgi:hypothetical protein